MIDSSFAEKKSLQNKSILNDEKITFNKDVISSDNFDPIKYLGKNSKNILVLINEKEHAFLGDDELSFLMNILNACNVSMADAALVNVSNDESINYEKLTKQFLPEVILFLGTEPQLLGFPVQIPMYQVQQYNKQQYLCAPALQKLYTYKEEKKQLWLCLKKIFSI